MEKKTNKTYVLDRWENKFIGPVQRAEILAREIKYSS